METNNRIREEWIDRYIKIHNDTDCCQRETVKNFIAELLKSQKEEHKCSCTDFPTFYSEVEKRVKDSLMEKIELLYGDTITIKKDIAIPHSCIEYETALDDIINLIKEE